MASTVQSMTSSMAVQSAGGILASSHTTMYTRTLACVYFSQRRVVGKRGDAQGMLVGGEQAGTGALPMETHPLPSQAQCSKAALLDVCFHVSRMSVLFGGGPIESSNISIICIKGCIRLQRPFERQQG